MDLETIILSEVSQSQKTIHSVCSLKKWILGKELGILSIQLSYYSKLKRKEDQKEDASSYLEGRTK